MKETDEIKRSYQNFNLFADKLTILIHHSRYEFQRIEAQGPKDNL